MSFEFNAAKYIVALSASVLLLSSTICPSIYAASKGVVTGDAVNVRKEPSMDSNVVSKVDSGQYLDIVSAKDDWFKIKLADGTSAYIVNGNVKVTRIEGIVVDDSVNLRDIPNTDGKVITTFNAGAVFTVSGKIGDFYCVDYNGGTCYIHNDYVVCRLEDYIGSVQSNTDINYEHSYKEDSKPETVTTMPDPTPDNETPPSMTPESVAPVETSSPAAESALANADYSNQYALVTESDGINLRASASEQSTILAKLPKNEPMDILGVGKNWNKVSYDGLVGFVKSEYVSINTGVKPPSTPPSILKGLYVLVTEDGGLNLRRMPSSDSEILAKLPYGEAMDLINPGTEWVRVSYNGIVGYVSSDFTSIREGNKPDNTLGSKVVAFAKEFLGTPYVWGGTNLNRGVDCSGFVYSVMRNFGITLNRSSRDQIYNGRNVSKSQLRAGDLVFFDTTNARNRGYISHVGIYIGDGKFIHSSSSSKSYCVTISSLSENYYTMRYVGATRVLN